MRSKIFRNTLSIVMITMTVCVSLVIAMLYTFFENNYAVELKNEADYIASSVDAYGIEYLETVDFGNMRVSYIESNGAVLYDNRADVSGMGDHSQREEIAEAISTGYGESARLSETMSEKTYYVARRLKNGDVVRISDTRDSEWALASKLFAQIVIMVLLLVILSALFSGRLARLVVKPINEIDLAYPEKGGVYDELTPLLKRVSQQNRQIKEQMELLRKERTEFSAITSNMSEGFVVIDLASNILSSNTAASALLGGDSISGGNVFSLNRSEEFISCIDRALAGKGATAKLFEKGRIISVFANPVYSTGHVIGALILLMDITEREARDGLRREFTANVSHELKTPLTSISAAAEMMMSGMVKTEDIGAFSTKIYTEAQRLINLIQDIIKLSKLDEGGSALQSEEKPGGMIVRKAINALEDAAKEKNITITTDIDDITLKCIEPLFEEIVYNLCDNAIKYTPEGGRVEISFKTEGKTPVLKVKDNGIGVPVGEQERIFERFYRVDKGHSGGDGGTGLGLSIVKHAVLIHNGTIKLDSKEGQGSCFTVKF